MTDPHKSSDTRKPLSGQTILVTRATELPTWPLGNPTWLEGQLEGQAKKGLGESAGGGEAENPGGQASGPGGQARDLGAIRGGAIRGDRPGFLKNPRGQAGGFIDLLQNLGAKTIVHPVIQVLAPVEFSRIDDVISRIDLFDWVVFFSTTGVRCFLERFLKTGMPIQPLFQKKIAAIGGATAAQLSQLTQREVDLVPQIANSDSLATALVGLAGGQRVLLVRADRGSQTVAHHLQRAGIEYEEVAIYRSVDVETPDAAVAIQVGLGHVDWVTMTSSAIAKSTIRLFGDGIRQMKTVSISPTTSAAMIELGVYPDVESTECSLSGVVDSILRKTGQS